MWERGATVVHQEVWKGRIWAARPLTVVDDTPELTMLWIPEGTLRKIPVTPPTRPDPPDIHARTIASLDLGDWALGEHRWDVSTLWILRPGDWYSIWVSWRADGSHLGWYVNMQRPMRRNPIGFEAMDLMLDVVAKPDLSWRWKDDEEFNTVVSRGIFDAELGRHVRSTAEAVIGDIENRREPFSAPWPSWTPDPSWSAPRLPPGWDVVHD